MLKYSPTEGGEGEVMQITYQKQDGCIFQRQRNTTLPYRIGETTSMGWKVLSIEYKFKDKYYPENKYNMLIQKEKKSSVKKKQTIELFRRELKTLIYSLISIILLKLMLGI